MRVLETAVNELKVECESAQKPRYQVRTVAIAKASNNVTNNMDFNIATKKADVAEPIMARLNSFRPDSTRSPRSVIEERGCLRQGHEDEERRSLPAPLRRRSS